MGHEKRVAVFVDTENVAQWVKLGGLDTLLEELSSIGTVVVRKAYARWTNTNMAAHQATLNRHGFELIHTYHPVSGKNSADIQIAVDVMEYAWRDDLACIALATGDSDFSPLFRRLREMGKQVVGVGPRSALSESVKSSCSRFFYTELGVASPGADPASRASDFDDAADLLEAALKNFDGPANCSALKNRMLSIDSAFNEKSLGFKSFTAFATAVDGIELAQDGQSWTAAFQESETPSGTAGKKATETVPIPSTADLGEVYRQFLRKKNWRTIPALILTHFYTNMEGVGPLSRPDLVEATIARCGGDITTTEARKAMQMIFKAKLVTIMGTNEEGESLWKIRSSSEDEMLRSVDLAMLVRLSAALSEQGMPLVMDHIAPLLLRKRTDNDIDALVDEAKALAASQDSGE